jgi:hypothetical protein
MFARLIATQPKTDAVTTYSRWRDRERIRVLVNAEVASVLIEPTDSSTNHRDLAPSLRRHTLRACRDSSSRTVLVYGLHLLLSHHLMNHRRDSYDHEMLRFALSAMLTAAARDRV